MVLDLERARDMLQMECQQLQARLDQIDKEYAEEIQKTRNLSAE